MTHGPHRIIYGRYTGDAGNRALARWVALRIPYVDSGPAEPFGPAECVGVERERRLIAAVVFHMWDPASKTIAASMAADTAMWARRETIADILKVPFDMCGARKLYVMIRSDNAKVTRFVRHVGFREEARLSEHYGPHLHAVIFGLKKKHYAGLKERPVKPKITTDYKVEGAPSKDAARMLQPLVHHNETPSELFDGYGQGHQRSAA